MSKYYRGFWSFAPLPEPTTYAVWANNEEEAIEKLSSWAFSHQSIVDEPMDFEVEELDNTRLELARRIVAYDSHYNEYDGTVWKIYEATKNPKALAEMARDYVGDLKHQQEITEDFQTYSPRQRAVAKENQIRISKILRLIREITTKEFA